MLCPAPQKRDGQPEAGQQHGCLDCNIQAHQLPPQSAQSPHRPCPLPHACLQEALVLGLVVQPSQALNLIVHLEGESGVRGRGGGVGWSGI